ncbi:MAG: M20/M25/M40 family metallo-hydrolase [Bacillota bacterium]
MESGRGTGGGKSLILNDHVDTITPEPISERVYGPFSGKMEDGKIYGRGSSDMKSGLAAMTMAARILKELDFFLEAP